MYSPELRAPSQSPVPHCEYEFRNADNSLSHQRPPVHNCEHLKHFLSTDAGANNIRTARSFIRSVVRGLQAKSNKVLSARCFTCHTYSGNLHGCLSCMFIGCKTEGHMADHYSMTGHKLVIDLWRGFVYCFECQDYVYSSSQGLDKEVVFLPDTRKKRRRLDFVEYAYGELEHRVLYNSPALTDDALLGLRGLNNMGNTCFMNSILQSFVHNPLLRNYFLADAHNRSLCTTTANMAASSSRSSTPTPNENGPSNPRSSPSPTPPNLKGPKVCIACELDNLFSQAYSGIHTPFSPSHLLYSVWSHAQHLAGYEQQDAHEFLISCLDVIHNHCNGTSSNNCRCIVHRTFCGVLRSDVTCATCGQTSTAYDPFFDISLDIRLPSQGDEDESPLSSEHMSNSLMDCLHRYTSPERLRRSERVNCSSCKTYQECIKQLSMRSLPFVLCFHLKRFEHFSKSLKVESNKIDAFIEFPTDSLDMRPYLSSTILRLRRRNGLQPNLKHKDARTNGRTANSVLEGPSLTDLKDEEDSEDAPVYDLFAVVVHYGTLEKGHYICKVRKGDRWFKCDDANISPIDSVDVNRSHAYLLFYVRRQLLYMSK